MHISWLESLPAVIVDLSTFGLAALGGYVALNAPKDAQVALKRAYVSSFIALAILGIGANIWQRNIESGKQVVLQQNETDARNQFSANLTDVKKSSEAILNFVSHPPKGFTQEQIVSVVRSFLDKQQSKEQLTELTNELQAFASVSQVVKQFREWRALAAEEQDINARYYDAALQYEQQHPNDQQGLNRIEKERQVKLLDAEDKYGPEALAKLIATANSIRKELTKRIPLEQWFPLDKTEEQKFTEAINNPDVLDKDDAATYLENLVKRVPSLK